MESISTQTEHGWLLETINDLRVYAREHDLRFCEEAFNHALVSAIGELGIDEDAETVRLSNLEVANPRPPIKVISLSAWKKSKPGVISL